MSTKPKTPKENDAGKPAKPAKSDTAKPARTPQRRAAEPGDQRGRDDAGVPGREETERPQRGGAMPEGGPVSKPVNQDRKGSLADLAEGDGALVEDADDVETDADAGDNEHGDISDDDDRKPSKPTPVPR